jgi:plastocyanin
MRKFLLAVPALAIAIAVVFGSTGQTAMAAAVNLKIRAGAGEQGYAVNQFLPGTTYVNTGDTVTWSWTWIEPHTVTFGEPQGDPTTPADSLSAEYDGTGVVNSGLLDPGPTGETNFSIKFTKAGTYDYYCAIHPGMTGEVVVQGPGVGVQDTQVAVDARGAAAYDSSIGALKAAAASQSMKPVAVTAGVSGGKKYTLAVSSATDLPQGDVMQFFPSSLNIGVNDQVEFVSDVQTPHDIAFPGPYDLSGPPPPGLEDFDPFSQDVNYSPGVKLDNSKPVISPMIGVGYPAGQSATFAFSKAGTYAFGCVLHADQGMVGVINVGTNAPLPPNTGDTARTAPSGTSGLWLVFASVGLALAATVGAFAASRR